jgi:murein DD-endopeptidase MepM/ murein hydrolase activator NlpD
VERDTVRPAKLVASSTLKTLGNNTNKTIDLQVLDGEAGTRIQIVGSTTANQRTDVNGNYITRVLYENDWQYLTTYTWTVTLIDRAGNESFAETISYTTPAPPVLTSVCAATTVGKLNWPFNGTYTIVEDGKFGKPRNGGSHDGLDFAFNAGREVIAAHDGTVMNYTDQYGAYYVDLTNGNVKTRYLHLSKKNLVPDGTFVTAKTLIGISGGEVGGEGSGYTFGPHLHFSVFVSGFAVDPFTQLQDCSIVTPGAPSPTNPGNGGDPSDLNNRYPSLVQPIANESLVLLAKEIKKLEQYLSNSEIVGVLTRQIYEPEWYWNAAIPDALVYSYKGVFPNCDTQNSGQRCQDILSAVRKISEYSGCYTSEPNGVITNGIRDCGGTNVTANRLKIGNNKVPVNIGHVFAGLTTKYQTNNLVPGLNRVFGYFLVTDGLTTNNIRTFTGDYGGALSTAVRFPSFKDVSGDRQKFNLNLRVFEGLFDKYDLLADYDTYSLIKYLNTSDNIKLSDALLYYYGDNNSYYNSRSVYFANKYLVNNASKYSENSKEIATFGMYLSAGPSMQNWGDPRKWWDNLSLSSFISFSSTRDNIFKYSDYMTDRLYRDTSCMISAESGLDPRNIKTMIDDYRNNYNTALNNNANTPDIGQVCNN